MMPMKDKIFLDSNILVYSYSNNEPDKKAIARKLITEYNSYISTQVLQELTNIATKKLKFTFPDSINAINECIRNNNLHVNSFSTILQACEIAERYQYSFYDSLIISAALESGCSLLYSEDMQSDQLINSTLKIINPFL